jgi:hypothetical protein
MTNKEKLEAIRRAQPGSYNIAPMTGAEAETVPLHHIVQAAFELAVERGYFHRTTPQFQDDNHPYSAILVTVSDPTQT